MAQPDTDALVEEIERTRLRLAGTVDQLIDRTNPKNIVRRTMHSTKVRFITETGEPKMEAIIPVALGVIGFVGVLYVIRRIVR